MDSLLLEEGAELRVELRHAASAVEQSARTTGPCRMGVRIDVQVQGRAFLAVGRAGAIGGTIGHHHGDEVVVGMDVLLHRALSRSRAFNAQKARSQK